MTEQDEWLTWRLGGVTASDIARSATGSYGGIYGVVLDKLNPKPHVTDNPIFNRGHRWEQRIADTAALLHSVTVAGEQAWCQHADNPLHRATVDGFLAYVSEPTIDDVNAVLEIKTAGVGVKWNRPYWHAQVQWQMHVTQLDRALIAVAVIDDTDDTPQRLSFEWVDADPFMQSIYIELADRILEHVAAGTLPDPDTDTALDLVNEATATANKDAPAVDMEDIAEDVAEYQRIKDAKKAAEAREKQLAALIKHRLGEATKGTAGGYVVSYSANSNVVPADIEAALLDAHPDYAARILDRDRFKADHPDLWEQSRRPIGTRRLTVKEPK